MAKRRTQQSQSQLSSGATLAILSIGGLLVVALVVWALTRSVERAPAAATATSVSDVPQVAAGDTANPAASRTIGEEQSPEMKAVPRMAAEDLRSKLNRNAVTVIDVRDAASFESGHIPGSVHIPLAAIEGAASTLPKDKQIVTYCT